MRARSTRVAAVVLIAALLAPLALADHAYSHRYVVFGRLIGMEGMPLPNVTIGLAVSPGLRVDGSCAGQPGNETDAFGPTRTSLVTNAHGEFIACMHVHTLTRNASHSFLFEATSVGASTEVPVDAELRQSFALLAAPEETGVAPPEDVYTVVGRAWRANHTPVAIESISVYGDTIRLAPVTVTLPGHDPVATTTNAYGDFAVRIPLAGATPEGEVLVDVNGTEFRAPVDARARVTHVPARFPALDPAPLAPTPTPTPSPAATPAQPAATPATPAPATPTPEITTPTSAPTEGAGGPEGTEAPAPFPWVAALAAAAGVALLMRRRHST